MCRPGGQPLQGHEGDALLHRLLVAVPRLRRLSVFVFAGPTA